jgi:hypothetical protein
MVPMSALRLLQTETGIQAQLVVAWHEYVSPSVRRPGVNARCDPDNPDACVEVFESPAFGPPPGQDWTSLFRQLLIMGPCSNPNGPVTVITDSGDLIMHVIENGRTREYYCNGPRAGATPAARQAGALLTYLDERVRAVLGR